MKAILVLCVILASLFVSLPLDRAWQTLGVGNVSPVNEDSSMAKSLAWMKA